MKNYFEMAKDCTHGDLPACTTACPYRLDIKGLLARVQRGKTDSAYRLYRDIVIFPGIVSKLCDAPCMKSCERCEVDEAIDILGIERSVVKSATKKTPNKINLPSKGKKVAIIGAGPSGLACALRLSERKYDVVVYEASDKIGGSLWDALDPDDFIPELKMQFEFKDYELKLSSPIESFEDLEKIEANAVLISTGGMGRDFGLAQKAKTYRPLKVYGRYFLSGTLNGDDIVNSIYQGGAAANMIETYINTGSPLDLVRDPRDIPNRPDPSLLVPTQPVKPADGKCFTPEEAASEAERCIRCDCDSCMRRCPIVSSSKQFPNKIAENIDATVHPKDLFKNRIDTRLIASCDHCGICVEICPQHIDLNEMLLDAKREMVRKGNMPEAYRVFWTQDMMDAIGEQSSIFAAPPDIDGDCEFAFFPGCQLGACDPRYVTEAYSALRNIHPDTALMLTCCGAPAFWSGDDKLHEQVTAELKAKWQELGSPTVICACPTCMRMLGEFIPEMEIVSLYSKELLDVAPQSTCHGEIEIFHPCNARHDVAMQDGVRSLLQNSNCTVVGANDPETEAMCCGWGGQFMIANPALASKEATRASELAKPESLQVTYCINCRNTLRAKRGASQHVLDILFGLNGPEADPPTMTQRRYNRFELKKQLMSQIWGVDMPDVPNSVELLIDDDVALKMSDRWILEQDVAEVISHCEEYGQKVVDSENDCFFGHLKIGFMTFWVQYRPEGNAFRVIDAYAHRMTIEEGPKWIPENKN